VTEPTQEQIETLEAFLCDPVVRIRPVNAALRALLDSWAEREREVERLNRAALEVADLVGPGGDNTLFGRVESALSRLTGEQDAMVEEAADELCYSMKAALMDQLHENALLRQQLEAEQAQNAEMKAALLAVDALVKAGGQS
jgi:hypothetical protein